MLLPFFGALRDHRVPVTLREWLDFLGGLRAGIGTGEVEAFYHFARCALVKDERHLDRFDRAFAAAFDGLESITDAAVIEAMDLPHDWLQRLAEKHLSEAEKREIETLGGFDKLMETL